MSNDILVRDLDVKDPGDHWESLYRFYRHCRYFTPAWILQELVLARDIVFLYGSAEFDLDSLVFLNEFCRLSDFAGGIYYCTEEKCVGSGAAVELEWLWRLRQSHINGGSEFSRTAAFMDRVYGARTIEERTCSYFEWIVSYSRRFRASLPHDEICAVLGIVSLYWKAKRPWCFRIIEPRHRNSTRGSPRGYFAWPRA
jgi:hypothetical protein